MTVRLFTDTRLLGAGGTGVPLLGLFSREWVDIDNFPGRMGRYDKLFVADASGFEWVDELQSSDYALLPFDWGSAVANKTTRQRAETFIGAARQAGKRTIAFYWSDNDEDLKTDAMIFYRTSLYRSRRQPYEFAMPSWSEDFARYGAPTPVAKRDGPPVVGFCGFGHPVDLKHLLRTTRKLAGRLLSNTRPIVTAAGGIRRRALESLQGSPLVSTNFVIRDHFGAKTSNFGGTASDAELTERRHDFVRNTLESDYVLCCRGAGNFSYRLYETLSCGRIPLIVDSDMVFPLEDVIPWDEIAVRLPSKRVHEVARHVSEHYASLDATRWRELQERARSVWEQCIEPSGYFRHLAAHLAGLSDRPA